MEDRTEIPDQPRFIPVNLPGSILSRRTIEGSDRDAHTHRELPILKRSATTSGNSRSRSIRYGEAEAPMQTLNAGASSAHWSAAGGPGAPGSSSTSASSGRRPSLLSAQGVRRAMTTAGTSSASSESHYAGDISVVGPDSPEDPTDFRRSLEINMKDLVGDAVGNMSISPSSRDIVLAARKGLFIIDLENPLEVPRFLPQGGTWDVADVQWNPHPARSQYIVSTSSEKMLIWNLNLTGKTSIEHILRSHYRAITDFNWHTTESDVVASTGIDSWIFVWDLRTPQKPVYGLSAFKDSGTQVKWNRHDGNFLASAHGNEVLIWDRRKGSLPMSRILAHNSKIYGIDWSHHLRNEIVTCSLDKTIKTWDTNNSHAPNSCIQTDYPVWRARNLPFGQGVLSLPQRGETRLEMFARGESPKLVETFDGHSDVVKEFVWRKGAPDEFQLITWSKDRTLRFWPVSADTMQKVGYSPEVIRGRSQLRLDREPTISYRNPPLVQQFLPILSAPIGNRSILAEVRAGAPPRSSNLITQPHLGSSARATPAEGTSQLTPTLADTQPIAITGPPAITRNRGGTMSRGPVTGKSVAHMDAFAWLSNVKVGNKRGGSSGGGSAEPESSSSSRLNSASRAPSRTRDESESVSRQRSASRSRGGEERRDGPDNSQSLQDEITTVLNKLASSKIKLEKIDLSKKRTCTLGLHGPWGERSSVFVRVTFTFPSKYPQAGHPEGTPAVELEKSPLISFSNRAFILKHLRAISERKRPCLEACLRFLLYMEEDLESMQPNMDSESSDDERDVQDPNFKGAKKEVTLSILRNHKNLAEPRTSQGTFGPNGELICFFRAPPRMVLLRGIADPTSPKASPGEEAPPSASEQRPQQTQQQSRLFQSPALVSDAIRQLSLAAKDRAVLPLDPRKPETDFNILRTMTNLLTASQHKMRRESIASNGGPMSKNNYSLLPTRRSNVFLMDTTRFSGPDKVVAEEYDFSAVSLFELCEKNAGVARERRRFDHERVFRIVQALLKVPVIAKEEESGQIQEEVDNSFASDLLAIGIIMQIYTDLALNKDIQMLAMLSIIVLQTPHGSAKSHPGILKLPIPIPSTARSSQELLGHGLGRLAPIKTTGFDYFSLARSINNMPSPMSPAWPGSAVTGGTPSPVGGGGMGLPPPAAPSVASSNSSRGSWSSLFNTGSMRQFMNGVQDSLKDGLTTPTLEGPLNIGDSQLPKISEKGPLKLTRDLSGGSGGSDRGSGGAAEVANFNLVLNGRRKRMRKEASMHSLASNSTGGSAMSRSWNESAGPRPKPVSFSSAGNRKGVGKVQDAGGAGAPYQEKRMVVFEPSVMEETPPPLFAAAIITQMRRHVLVYAELLFRWELYIKRLEMLNSVQVMPEIRRDKDGRHEGHVHQHRIGLTRMCRRPDCRMLLDPTLHVCVHCGTPAPPPACTICRLPVKGLSRSCLRCYHVTHISCWDSLGVPICPTGCGCFCDGEDAGDYTRPSTRLGMSPPTNTLLLSTLAAA
ncbi:hypothetical protein D9611_009784 [Ephemerocybe angulata]|uniref:WDR59/RTC1-like RING zinc finger domain-containing protein n=1 Tax=Ephemerocybe angulata TaxID=980116 RepID=A0A8H5CCU0_9AGAR|nr:hypothetical protein D9611_009784 [Tulosesus angulatus]